MKKVLFIPSVLLISQQTYAQTSKIKGRVVDSEGCPRPGATIQAQQYGKSGLYELNGIIII